MDASLLLCAALLASPAQDPQPTQDATLTVTVVDGTHGQALAGQPVGLLKLGATVLHGTRKKSRGPVGSRLVTDGLGQVVYVVPAGGSALELSVFGGRNGYGGRSLSVAPFTAGESRAVTLKLTPSERRPFHLLFVDSVTGEPIPGVRLGVMKGGSSAPVGVARDSWQQAADGQKLGVKIAAGDDNGRAVVEWVEHRNRLIDIVAPGYSLVCLPIEGTHPDPLHPKVIRVSPTASLVGTYWDADGLGASGLTVGALASLLELSQPDSEGRYLGGTDRLWHTTTDATGRFTLEGLPAGVELAFEVWRGQKALYELFVTLQPGETRDISSSLRPRYDLSGRLVDTSGKPIPMVRVQLSPVDSDHRGERGYLPAPYLSSRSQLVFTDSQGRFRFADIAMGEWLIGPELISNYRRPGPTWAGYGQQVRVPVDHEITVTGYQGTVTGRVRVPSGTVPDDMTLEAIPLDGFGSLGWEVQENGSFSLGPLGPGPHRFAVWGPPSGWYFEVLSGVAGDRLEFVALPAGSVQCRAVDSRTRQPQVARFILVGEDDSWGDRARFEQQAVFGNLVPGNYSLIATTEDARFGVCPRIKVVGGKASPDQVVALKPGGRIRLKTTDPRRFVVRSAGALVAVLGSGSSSEAVVPAGRVTVCPLERGQPVSAKERQLEITVGATTIFEPK
jgi:hypothetical protein